VRLEFRQRLIQHGGIVGVVRFGLDLDDELHLVLGVARLGHIGHVASVLFAALLTVGRFPIVGRLKAAGFQFFSCLGTKRRLIDVEMLLNHPVLAEKSRPPEAQRVSTNSPLG
jgi:hypothetical protein